MSKRRKRKSLVGRDILKPIPIAKRSLPRQSIRTLNQVLLDIARLTGQDQRRFTPNKHIIPTRTVSGIPASTQISPLHTPLRKARERFTTPKTVTVCIRRKQRKEVLHAIGKSGKNRGRRYRRTQWSSISC